MARAKKVFGKKELEHLLNNLREDLIEGRGVRNKHWQQTLLSNQSTVTFYRDDFILEVIELIKLALNADRLLIALGLGWAFGGKFGIQKEGLAFVERLLSAKMHNIRSAKALVKVLVDFDDVFGGIDYSPLEEKVRELNLILIGKGWFLEYEFLAEICGVKINETEKKVAKVIIKERLGASNTNDLPVYVIDLFELDEADLAEIRSM